jgi:DNA-binding transcriptional MerR regulator
MSESLSANQAAAKLGVPKTTILGWLKALPIDVQTDSRGQYKLTPDALAILARVQSLRGEGSGYETIRQALTTTDDQATTNPAPSDGVLLDLLRDERERSARLSERVAELSAVAAAHQARAAMLTERVTLLEAGQVRPWWKLWR